MGAWGDGPLDSDQALDWLAGITDHAGVRIEGLLTKFEKAYVKDKNSAVDEYAHELRAAGFVVLALNFFTMEDLHERMADALAKVRDNDAWITNWLDPQSIHRSLSEQIAALSQGPNPTSLFEHMGPN
jgi:hypothetical protein